MTDSTRRLLRSALVAVIIAALMPVIAILVAAFGSAANERVAIGFFINVVVVLGLQVFMGNSGVTNFGHPAFMGVAAYAFAVLCTPAAIKASTIPAAPFGLATVTLSPWVGALVALIVVATFGFVTGLAVVRQSDTPASIVTVALLVIFHSVAINWHSLTRGPRAFYGIPIRTDLIIVTIAAAIAIVVARVFRDSSAGVQLRASADDMVAAEATGVRVRSLRLVAWILGAVLIGLGGVLLAAYVGTLSVNGFFYFPAVFLVLSMLLLGGVGSVSGGITGAIVITVANEVMRYLENGPTVGPWTLPRVFGLPALFQGLTIILVMKFRPEGILGDREIDEWLLRARARLRRGRIKMGG
jgi:branched-chain amino acid transport system permease protein